MPTSEAARSQCTSPKPVQQSTGKNAKAGAFTPHGWQAVAGEASRRGCRSKVVTVDSPSTLAAPVRGRDSRLAAKERAAANERSADQRRVKAEMAAAREGGGADRARHLASKRTKVAASALDPTPTNLESNDSEPAAIRPAQLGIRVLFGSSCSEQGRSGSAAPSPAREAGGGVAARGGGVFAGGGVGCAGRGGCACCFAGGPLVRGGAVSVGGAVAAAGKGPNNVILASASSDSSCTMRCAPRLLKAWMRSARWPWSSACSAVLVPAMLPCGAGRCRAVRGKAEKRLERRLAELTAVLQHKMKRFRTNESTLSLHVTSIDHASHVHVKTYTSGQKLQTVLAKYEYRAQGKMLITPPGHPQ